MAYPLPKLRKYWGTNGYSEKQQMIWTSRLSNIIIIKYTQYTVGGISCLIPASIEYSQFQLTLNTDSVVWPHPSIQNVWRSQNNFLCHPHILYRRVWLRYGIHVQSQPKGIWAAWCVAPSLRNINILYIRCGHDMQQDPRQSSTNGCGLNHATELPAHSWVASFSMPLVLWITLSLIA